MILVFALLAGALAHAQSFEVASIKRTPPGARGMSIRCEHGTFTASNATLRNLIGSAYHLHNYELSGAPGWIDSDRFDVAARMPAGATGEQCWTMIGNLLAERFKLAVHRETRQVPGYALAVAKSGPRLREATTRYDDGVSRPLFTGSRGNLTAERINMTLLANMLAGELDAPVEDATGLRGDYQLHLEWTPENWRGPSNPDRPLIYTALDEQLGLKLESRHNVPVQAIVVDRIEREPTQN